MNDDIDLTVEPDEEGEIKSDKKLKKLRDELKAVKKERDDNLAGWQRSKADYVNLSRRTREEGLLLSRSVVSHIAKSILKVFDSLDAALETAENTNTKKGIDQVIKQLEQALSEHKVMRYTPKEGDLFSPEKHEPIQTVATDNKKMDNTISQVLQSGFEIEGEVIRPARVIVSKYE